MELKPDVEAIFKFLYKKKVCDGYRPSHLIKKVNLEDYLTTGLHRYYKTENNFNGKIVGTITFITPEAYPKSICIGKKIFMYEGSRLIGYATITKIFNEILLFK